MDEIILNGKTYVLKKDEVDDKTAPGIMDKTNVSMFYHIKDEYLKEDGLIELPLRKNNVFSFKRNGTLFEDIKTDFENKVCWTKAGTKIGHDFVEQANKVIKAMTWDKKKGFLNFNIYEVNEYDSFKKNVPVLLTYGDYGFLIAPRVDNE